VLTKPLSRFPSPLIKPDVPICGISLSDSFYPGLGKYTTPGTSPAQLPPEQPKAPAASRSKGLPRPAPEILPEALPTEGAARIALLLVVGADRTKVYPGCYQGCSQRLDIRS